MVEKGTLCKPDYSLGVGKPLKGKKSASEQLGFQRSTCQRTLMKVHQPVWKTIFHVKQGKAHFGVCQALCHKPRSNHPPKHTHTNTWILEWMRATERSSRPVLLGSMFASRVAHASFWIFLGTVCKPDTGNTGDIRPAELFNLFFVPLFIHQQQVGDDDIFLLLPYQKATPSYRYLV